MNITDVYFLETNHIETGYPYLGSAGLGKTTLGKMVTRQLGIPFVDIGNYLWHKDTAIPYLLCILMQKINRLMEAVSQKGCFVMDETMDSFHEYLYLFFYPCRTSFHSYSSTCQKRLSTGTWNKILECGVMYKSHSHFLNEIPRYNDGRRPISTAFHIKRMDSLQLKTFD